MLSGVELAELRVEVNPSHHHLLGEGNQHPSFFSLHHFQVLLLSREGIIKVLQLLLNGIMRSMTQLNGNELRTMCFPFQQASHFFFFS